MTQKKEGSEWRREREIKTEKKLIVEGKAVRFCPHKVFFAFDWNWSWSHTYASNNSLTRGKFKFHLRFCLFSLQWGESEWWIMNDWNVTKTRILHSFCIMLMMNNQSIVSGVCLAALTMKWNYLLICFQRSIISHANPQSLDFKNYKFPIHKHFDCLRGKKFLHNAMPKAVHWNSKSRRIIFFFFEKPGNYVEEIFFTIIEDYTKFEDKFWIYQKKTWFNRDGFSGNFSNFRFKILFFNLLRKL